MLIPKHNKSSFLVDIFIGLCTILLLVVGLPSVKYSGVGLIFIIWNDDGTGAVLAPGSL